MHMVMFTPEAHYADKTSPQSMFYAVKTYGRASDSSSPLSGLMQKKTG